MTLVLVHGFLGASNNWLGVTNLLKKKNIETFLVDLRWHGGDPNRWSVANSENIDTQAVADDLEKQLEARFKQNEELILLGHSFGLRPVLKLASKASPKLKIKAIVAEDSLPLLSTDGQDLLVKVLSKTPVPFSSRPEARDFFDAEFGKNSALSRFLFSNIREREGVHTWRFDADILLKLLASSVSEPLTKEWLSIEKPVHMIVGERSTHLSNDDATAWCQKRKDKNLSCSLSFVGGAGHWVHADNPQGFVEELAKVVNC